MPQGFYDSAPLPVRSDLASAHQRAWQSISEPGTWWTGEQRAAIAAETRNALACRLCRQRKAALSPYSIDGEHQSLGDLSDVVVDVVHRTTTDPGRLTRDWYDAVRAAGLGDAYYVETVAVVVRTLAIDIFARGIGIEPPALPSPVPGTPTEVRPEVARTQGAWVPTIAPEDATGVWADLYQGGFVPNVKRALSLVPDEARENSCLAEAQYLPVREVLDPAAEPPAGRVLTRPQMELIAARVSVLNGCFY